MGAAQRDTPGGTADPATQELAERLAAVLAPMRATSRFAVATFLQALETPDINGVSLTIHAARSGRIVDARVEIDGTGAS